MSELEAIVAAFDGLGPGGRACLATVVHVEGSAYRRAGARMLIAENGQMTGAISGGCLEGDALKKALFALETGQNKLVTYDTNDEDDAVVGAQLGCNGVVQVLFEPINPARPGNPIELLRKAARAREAVVLTTFFDLEKKRPQPGTALLFDADGNLDGSLSDPQVLSLVKSDARQAFEEHASLFREYQPAGGARLFALIELVAPRPSLVLVGAGNDAQVTAQMAGLLGWRVTVADGRPSHANAQRFRGGCQLVVAKPERLLEQVGVDRRTAFVLMTHNYQYDLAVLKLLFSQPEMPGYVGILGPRKKFERMLGELETDDIRPTPGQLERVFAPIGLALGAETAAEIAVSLLSEIMAVMNGSPGGHLRAQAGPIHANGGRGFSVKQPAAP